MNQKLITLVQAASYWVLFSRFALGFVMTNALLWAPWLVTERFRAHAEKLMHVIVNAAPYSWTHVSEDQLLVMGSILDLLGVLTLLVSPKLAAVGTMALTGWRQIFARINIKDLPNSPMCGYEAPYCSVNDVLYIITLVASIVVFTARKPMVETHTHLLKLLGRHTRRIVAAASPTLVGSPRKTD